MPQLTSTITCPQCGGVSAETMPTDAYQYFYDCRHCGAVLKALPGDCCVFCSYGDVPCPPVQSSRRPSCRGHDGTAARESGGAADCCGG